MRRQMVTTMYNNDIYCVGVTSNASIYSHPILQYQEGKEENKDGSNLLVQHRVRKGVRE